jgi:hypothetical protein
MLTYVYCIIYCLMHLNVSASALTVKYSIALYHISSQELGINPVQCI